MRRNVFIFMILFLVLSTAAVWAGAKPEQTDTSTGDKPSTWIADREIKGRIFLENDGESLPDDQTGNPVALKIKELTGITLDWHSTGHPSGLEELTLALASGDIPDVIENYLDHSGRPEATVILKAAREGMFVDLKPYLEKTKVYSKYITDENFAPRDSYDNVMARDEFNGAIYLVHMNIPASDRTDADRYHWRPGVWLREDIAESIGVGPNDIKTQDDLYNVLKKIKAGNFTDVNGNEVYPLGPRYWGGSWMATVVRNYDFGNGTRFDIDTDGKVKHVVETPYAFEQVKFYRKLLAEDLIFAEYFTINDVRSREQAARGSYAMMPWFGSGRGGEYGDIKDYVYIPIIMNNWKGEQVYYEKNKSAGNTWAISADAKNPEEIVQFADFLASQQGKALWNYGLEGEQYTIQDGKYIFTDSWKQFRENNPADVKNKVPSFWGGLLGNTWLNHKRDFGELWTGLNSEPERHERNIHEMELGNPGYKYWDGFSAVAYISDYPDIEFQLKPVLDEYADIMVKAVYADSDAKAKEILENYRDVLIKSGMQKYTAELQKIYKNDPKSVAFYIDATY
jgi:putative aldouronate transport system substrate-binding protein